MRRRVVITGMGVVTPLGHSVDDMFAALLAGKSGIDRITHFDARTFPTTFAAEVKGFDLAADLPTSAAKYADSGSNTRFALAAAKQALDHSGILSAPGFDPTRIGVYMGTGEGSEDFHAVIAGCAASCDATGAKVDHGKFATAVTRVLHPRREAELEMNTTAAHVADEFELAGPNFTCLTACAASAQAVGEAAEMIRYGDADVFVAGGSHSMIHPFGVTGFNLLTALSTRNDSPQTASRPFDATRDGFVLGEGGGVVILEEYEHAKKRGAAVIAELTGYGTTGDAHAMTDPHPGGRGAILSMRNALTDAGLNPADLGYINAHGTSTPANDQTETVVLKSALGPAAYQIPVSSTKSMLGHLIAAGGVVELIIAVVAMRRGVLPPTMNLHHPDPACDLDYVPNAAREKVGVRHVASNSFGFGGQNITLVASRV
jgi:3-oxoacyl-[acyl-carrier-protein] synthase II